MLKLAQKYKKDHVELIEMGGDNLQFKEAFFDYVVLSHVIAVVEQPNQVLDEVYNVLKPKGKVFILNHFTPNNWLQYIDKSFDLLSRTIHFKSFFSIDHLKAMERFSMVKQISLGKLSYFKLLILEKP
jgi:phosphatidylethanolamine/phosphatidyl-N-methylethanolamine N-methyltransferase